MRLPENDREETNGLLLAAIAVAAVIVGLVYLSSWYS
jgi:hypothetical protein